MKSVEFPEVTNKIAEHQVEFNTVHVQYQSNDRSVNMCFEFTDEEIKEIVRTKQIWYKQQIGNSQMHPMRLAAFKNEIIE
ncbi:MAG: hypothetical protein KGZ87_05425 [Bacteroidetes bacterium]|nr:hypothetical protein [Bacteroidota bacterium]